MRMIVWEEVDGRGRQHIDLDHVLAINEETRPETYLNLPMLHLTMAFQDKPLTLTCPDEEFVEEFLARSRRLIDAWAAKDDS